MTHGSFATRWNLDAIEAAYQRWRQDPSSVEDSWRYFFEGFDNTQPGTPMPHGGHNRAAIDLVRNFLEIKDEDLRASIGSLLKAVRDQQQMRERG